jgi:hypothetical protein
MSTIWACLDGLDGDLESSNEDNSRVDAQTDLEIDPELDLEVDPEVDSGSD